MASTESVSYQVFESYYKRAKEAESLDKPEKAKEFYLLASESLLRAAKNVSGDTKRAMIRRADRLQMLADYVSVPEDSKTPTGASGSAHGAKASEPAGRSDESETVWVRSKKPDVCFDDVAGLSDVKESIHKRVIQPRLYPEIFKAYQKSVGGGILLYGPPGTGKTMIAKAIAAEVDAEFYAVRCSDIVGKYFGEAEKNVRNLFDIARAAGSAILFFDEFEALATHRGGDSTVMNRLVPELLGQIDGFSVSDRGSLLFLAATNRPWDIDSAFLRPPRLTEKIYVGLPDYEARLYLIKKLIGPIPHDRDMDMERIGRLTEGYNAADVVELCEAMKDGPIKRSIERNDGNLSDVNWKDAEYALSRVPASVQQKDVDEIKRWEERQRGGKSAV